MDIVASNAGSNTRYQPFLAQPVHLYYGDFNRIGGIDIFEAYSHPSVAEVVPWRSLASVAQHLPFVRAGFPTHHAYARASIRDILGARLDTARVCSAQWFETTVFLNRGTRFEARPLPREAQVSPGFGIGIGDFDGDGHEDLVLAQNFFAVHPEDSPYGSGRGLWLRGDGTGNFHPVPAAESGIEVYGEQRGCAVADFDQDGRLDFALAQNGGPTRLFRNVGGRPGLRVRLKGPPGNPQGIGAVLRLVENDRFGPAREVRAGGGYWSQPGAVQVMNHPNQPTHLWVRWPAGQTQLIELPDSAREIVVSR